MFSTVLIANRGEIACRIIETLHGMGITAIAIYSESDAGSKHVRLADRALCVGASAASDSYLNIDAVIKAAQDSGADAIHPGYGFLSENADFARACTNAGVTLIGPGIKSLDIMGDKIRSKNHVASAGVPLVNGTSDSGMNDDALIKAGLEMPFPLLIKPSAGGGGKGMYVVEDPEDLADTIVTARRIAQASFGDDTIFIEQLIQAPRHIEVQVLADDQGNVIHLGERECSLQRRHQKVIEEAPSPLLDEVTRQRIGQAACDTARSVDYVGAGTVEFLVSDRDPEKFYFMEMNTRLQVEHPVTEQVTGIDLVEQQVRIAAGLPFQLAQQDITLVGHSVEARLYAEDPWAGFMPSTGTILQLIEPEGDGIRVDSNMDQGFMISTDYDPMLAKIIATGADRDQALSRLHQAFRSTVVHGVKTNTAYLQQLVTDPDVRAGHLDTSLIERKMPELVAPEPQQHHATAAALFIAQHKNVQTSCFNADNDGSSSKPTAWQYDGWRMNGQIHPQYSVSWQAPGSHYRNFDVNLDESSTLGKLSSDGLYTFSTSEEAAPIYLTAETKADHQGTSVWVSAHDFTGLVVVMDREAVTQQRLNSLQNPSLNAESEITAPMQGTIVSINSSEENKVIAGDVLIIIEAMKMEHQLTAPTDGFAHINVNVGESVKLGQVVASVKNTNES